MTHEQATRFPYRLAAIDLDGTLLDHDLSIHDDNLRAVRALQSHGVEVVLASGRGFESMRPFHRRLGLRSPLVTCQGAYVRETDSDSVLFEHYLPPALVRDAIDHARRHDLTVLCYTVNGTLVERRDVYVALYEALAGISTRLCNLDETGGQGVLKLIYSHHPDRLASQRAVVAQRYEGQLDVVITKPELLELLTSGVHKARGVAAVAEQRGISPRAVIAMGDGDNDVEMLAWAGLGVAMTGSTPAARKAARLHVPPGPQHNSLARAVSIILKSTNGGDLDVSNVRGSACLPA